MRKKVVSVVGGRGCNAEVERLSHQIGEKLANVADVLVSGGLSGVMSAVSKGFKQAGSGITMGIIPGDSKEEANPYIDIVLPTGMGLARNVLVVKSADVVVAMPGECGTLSEIAYCMQFNIPVVCLVPGNSQKEESLTVSFLDKTKPLNLYPNVFIAANVDEAVERVRDLLQNKK